MTHALVDAVRRALAEHADPAKAPDMQRYMKSAMPFRGVQKPLRQRLTRELFTAHPIPDVDTWETVVRELWHGAEYREERYVAVDLTADRRYLQWQTPERLRLYEELIASGAWWDYVDEIAIRRIGPILRTHPAELTTVVQHWAADRDRWKRRTAVICQVSAKSATDTVLLEQCITANLSDPDFFLRKGIGWALRDYARTDPAWVRTFVGAHPDLSPLSRREALKHLG